MMRWRLLGRFVECSAGYKFHFGVLAGVTVDPAVAGRAMISMVLVVANRVNQVLSLRD